MLMSGSMAPLRYLSGMADEEAGGDQPVRTQAHKGRCANCDAPVRVLDAPCWSCGQPAGEKAAWNASLHAAAAADLGPPSRVPVALGALILVGVVVAIVVGAALLVRSRDSGPSGTRTFGDAQPLDPSAFAPATDLATTTAPGPGGVTYQTTEVSGVRADLPGIVNTRASVTVGIPINVAEAHSGDVAGYLLGGEAPGPVTVAQLQGICAGYGARPLDTQVQGHQAVECRWTGPNGNLRHGIYIGNGTRILGLEVEGPTRARLDEVYTRVFSSLKVL